MNVKIQKEIIYGAIAILVSAAIGLISMRIWEIDISVLPKNYDDVVSMAALAESINENGIAGIYFNERLGAPESSSLIDFQFFDFLLAGMVALVNLFTSDGVMTIYIVYFLGFPLAAAGMFFLLTYLRIESLTKVTLSILFAVSPYHFLRGIGHLTLSNYFIIPLGVYLAFIILDYDRIKECKVKRIFACISAVLVGLSCAYYAFFVAVILGVALLFKIAQNKNLKVFLYEARYLYIISAGVFMEILPKLIYSVFNGKNYESAVRYPSEAEHLGLKIIQLFLPPAYSRIGKFRAITEMYQNSGVEINENVTSSMGMVATIGFLLVCIWFFISYLRIDENIKYRSISKRQFETLNKYCNFLALSMLALLLLSMVGGFGVIFNSFVTPLIRAYCRVSILIMCICLTMLALFCNNLGALIKNKVCYFVVVLFILCLGLYDQVKIEKAEWQVSLKQSDKVYADFFAGVENALENGDMVYQLPYMDFPEADFQIVNMGHYAPFLGYLYTDSIRWSYGGVKGRNTIAKEMVCDNGMSDEFLENLKQYGFAGVCIDTYGFEDSGTEVCGFYDGLNTESKVSEDGRFYFYVLP